MSADPDADDYKWLVARERGEDLGHVATADRAAYERIGALIGSGMAPRPGFRKRVLDAIDAEERAAKGQPEPLIAAVAEPTIAAVEPVAPEPPRVPKPTSATAVEPVAPVVSLKPKPSRWPRIAGGTALAAAAVVALVLVQLNREKSETGPAAGNNGMRSNNLDGSMADQVALATELRRDGPVVRAAPDRTDEASIGDTLVVRAEAPAPAEVRVYGGFTGRLLAKCNDGGGCAVERIGGRRRFTLEVKLEVPGEVRAVVFVGPNIPETTGAKDPDLEAAAGAGIRTETRPPTNVL